jgi:hypothetical protein
LPSLIVIDLQDGRLLLERAVPVYPDGPASVQGGMYLVSGRDGFRYSFVFSGYDGLSGNHEPDVFDTFIPVYADLTDQVLESYIKPSSAVTEVMLDKLSNWQGFTGVKDLPDPQLYISHDAPYPFTQGGLFVFSPEVQDTYAFGMCDETGSWIQARAFTAIFTDTGEMQAVSLDYVADRPQLSVPLSDREVYYILSGFLTDTTETDTGETQDVYFVLRKEP